MTNQNASDTRWVQNRYGQRILIDPDDFIGRKVLRRGVYDLETLRFLDVLFARLQPSVILDVGANIGNHTLMFARHARQVVAFEPGQRAFALLSQNIQANDLDHVVPVNVGLSDQSSAQTLYVETSSNLGESSLDLKNLTTGQYAEEIIQLRIGDDVVADQQLASVDFIKIDVEGHEQAVIRGLRQTIALHRPVILMEWEMEKGWLESERASPELLKDYEYFPLVWNTDRAYWRLKPLGFLRRLALRVFGTKQRVPCPLEISRDFSRVSDVLLVPREKMALVDPLVYR